MESAIGTAGAAGTSSVVVALAAALGLVACSTGAEPMGSARSSDAGAQPTTQTTPNSSGVGNRAEPPETGGSTSDPEAPAAAGSGSVPATAGTPSPGDAIVPLFDATTELEPEVLFDRGDAVVTRFGDRGRDRHAREDQFQSYDHYLPHYWEHRTARFRFVDYVAKGGSTLDVSFVTEWKLGPAEFRAWYYGMGSVAHYHGNYAPMFQVEGPGSYDEDHVRVGDGVQYKYSYTIESAIDLDGNHQPLAVGQFMEIEVSQFLDAPPVGRENYYGTVFLYEIGRGGLVPWHSVGDFDDKASERENSHELDERAWLGGRTTLPCPYSDEPDNHFMQMATNLSSLNAQPFVRGRRVHHTDMLDGSHDESADNGTFQELTGLVGPSYVNRSCDGCHTRNGRAPVADVGAPLDRWVFKIAAADGSPDPLLGAVLQPSVAGSSAGGEGEVSIARWVENEAGLRSPEYAFAAQAPARFSARIAPQLVGLGLLEAVAESTVLALADANDADGDGISGRAQVSVDPVTGQRRLGRFGWKAGASSLTHQIAGALNTDMGVMTSVLPSPDCGAMQDDCGNDAGPELGDEHLADLVKYVALLGVRARREIDLDEALRGEAVFEQLGCAGCHTAELTTSPFHPFAELRTQVIHPYTDLLLHDMGPGLADTLGEGEATGAEWRTTPLWGLGLSACVTGGVEGPFQQQVCAPHPSYLHDGRARTIDEAIRWHGGEGQAANDAYVALAADDKAALLRFLESL
jgi:CxxC motif-containing protein (DUF1111 family)